jgi:hypothetical protein
MNNGLIRSRVRLSRLGSLLSVAALFVSSLGLTACEDDGNGSFAAVPEAKLEFLPGVVSFPGVTIGAVEPKSLTIKNASNSAPVTFTIDLVESRQANDTQRELSIDDLQDTYTLQPGRVLNIEVLYAPLNDINDSGALKFTSTGGLDLGEVPIETAKVGPDIDGPNRVITGRVPAGQTGTKDFFVQNVGLADLDVTGMRFSQANPEFGFCVLVGTGEDELCVPADEALPKTIEPYEFIYMRLSYTPTDDTADTIDFIVDSNDPDENPFVMEISANGADPCITVTNEDGLDFGPSFIGDTSQRTMTITNCSPTQDLEISGIALAAGSEDTFFLEDGTIPVFPVAIGIEGTLSFVVSYAPTTEAQNMGALEILSNDEAKSPLAIPLSGSGTFDQCPTAIATGQVESLPPSSNIDTGVLETLQLDGSASNNGAAGTRYQWSVIQRPTDSVAQISNSAVARPTFFVDLAGLYKFQLDVFNENGTQSCAPATVDLSAVPGEAIHVQLVWDEAVDLDLHFKQRDGSWENQNDDVYYLNKTPTWAGGQHPSLDIDDVNGHGPENVNLDDPISAGYYNIGVDVYSGRVSTYATIRIYLDGLLTWEHRDRFLAACGGGCEFWEPADIDWGSRRVIPQDRVYTR